MYFMQIAVSEAEKLILVSVTVSYTRTYISQYCILFLGHIPSVNLKNLSPF